MKLSFFRKNFIVLGTMVAFSAVTFSTSIGQEQESRPDFKVQKKVNIFAQKAKRAAKVKELPKLSSLSNMPPALGSLPPAISKNKIKQASPELLPNLSLIGSAKPQTAGKLPSLNGLPNQQTFSGPTDRVSLKQDSSSRRLQAVQISSTLGAFPNLQVQQGSAKKEASNLVDPLRSIDLQKNVLSKVPNRQKDGTEKVDAPPQPAKTKPKPITLQPTLKVKQPAKFVETPRATGLGIDSSQTANQGVTTESGETKKNVTLQIGNQKSKGALEAQKPGPLFNGRIQKTKKQQEAERNRQLDSRLGRRSISPPQRSSNFAAGNRIRRPNQSALIGTQYYDARSIGNGVQVIGPNLSSFTYSPQVAATRTGAIQFLYNPARPSGQLMAAPTVMVNPSALRQPRIVIRNGRPRYVVPVHQVRPIQPQRSLQNVQQFIRN